MTSRAASHDYPNYDERDRETRRLLTRAAREGEPGAAARLRNEAVLLNRPMALALARQYRGRGIDEDDLEQVALVGLIKAVRGYRRCPGKSFAAYAVPTISGELKRHFRDCGWLVRPPRSLQELGQAVRTMTPQLFQRLRREPTTAEIAAAVGVSRSLIEQARMVEGHYQGMSIDAPITGTSCARDTLPDPRDPYAAAEAALTLGPAIAHLGTRDRWILRLRFVDNLTQEQIGRRIGVSQMQVSRLLSDILSRLRQLLEDPRAIA